MPPRSQIAKPPDSEKLTINLGFVDLGHIDLLVRDGFYSNRSDFIRTAIRNQLAAHADAAKEAASRLTLELGLGFTAGPGSRPGSGRAAQNSRAGACGRRRRRHARSRQEATIETITVLGALHAPAEVKTALADRVR